MPIYKIKKGFNLPISGAPKQIISDRPDILRVGLLGDDYHGLRARTLVEEGQSVKRGEPLFEDRKNPGVLFTSPGAGEVVAINRGARRMLQSIVVQLNKSERSGDVSASDCADFSAYPGNKAPDSLSADAVRAFLIQSGYWTALRTRPFSKVPAVDSTPYAIFVNAMDTNPLATDPAAVIEHRVEDFHHGLRVLRRLIEGSVYLCVNARSVPMTRLEVPEGISKELFQGPHPAGNSGVHINALAPVGRNRTVWTIGYQDVIGLGATFATGRLDVDRVVALGGPPVLNPRLVRSRLGASTDDHAHGELRSGDHRLISGSVLAGKKAMGPVFGHLSRYDTQISVVEEDRKREFMGWAGPGQNRFSVLKLYAASMMAQATPRMTFDFTTTTNGSHRPIIPVGVLDNVMPMDIMATYLMRTLAVGDVEQAERLGILELDEEDVALCTYVDPGKNDFGPMLRANLLRIEKEG